MRRSQHLAVWFFSGALLIMLGLAVWEMGVLYVKLVARTTPVPAQTQAQSENGVLSLPGITFWTSQTGVFQEEENARRQVQALVQQGWKAEIVAASPWSVDIGFARKPEELQELRLELKQAGIDTVVKQVVVPERSFRISGSGAQETAAVLTGVNALLRQGYEPGTREKYIAAIEKGISGYTIKEWQGLQDSISEIQAAPNANANIQSLLAVFVQYEKLLNGMSTRAK
ncbi:hypothetical protein [Paradesulfitobacterium ferrireducens]|uniref:hypothetical protein n=1 Tax=Paradesulfitobacterium ferrireducens TaxID=2816476 RepID=UPI001A8C46B5|nr:hypothetical protein [Paradesulfitobacterium ferrireducens]